MTASGHVNFDEVLRYLGQCGKWQWVNFFWLWLTSGAGGLAVVVWAFTAYSMNNRCPVSYCEDPESATYGLSGGNVLPDFVKDTPNEVLTKNCSYWAPAAGTTVGDCNAYKELLNTSLSQMEQMQCTHEQLIFDTSVVQTSLRTDYGLTCGKWINADVLGASYMLGMLVGSFVIGLISDKFGRMTALMLSVVLVSASGVIGAFMPNAIGFGIFRFITGIGGIGCFMVTFVLAVEYVGPKYTMLIGIAIEIPFAIGELVFGLEAYLIRDWVTLQLVAYAPLIILLLLWFILPESPRWLLACGHKEKAIQVIRKAAEVNKRTIPDHVLNGEEKGGMGLQDDQSQRTPTLMDMFQPLEIAFRSSNMMYQWFSVTMCYYGLTFASTSLSGDPYSNFALGVFVEIPGYLFCIFVMDCWGRRPILSFCQALSGVFCVLAGLLYGNRELAILQIIFSLVGKFGASACFAIVYVYTAELYPTIIRNTAIGSCSTVARVGGIVALLIQNLKIIWGPLPMLIMGCVAIVAGCLAILFPETVGHTLPETMDEALKIGKDSSRGICTCVCPKSVGEMFDEDDA